MSNIKLGESTLTNVESLKAIDANDSTKYHIFYNEQKAILMVTAPAGSTIDILQNSIVLQTYTLGASETTHEFRVSVSATTYTVRGTKGTKTKSYSVLVEQANVYSVKIYYDVIIYNNGAWDSEWSISRLAITQKWGSYQSTPILTDTGTNLSVTIPATKVSTTCDIILSIDKNASIDFSQFSSYTITYSNRFLANSAIYTWVRGSQTYYRQTYSVLQYGGTEIADISSIIGTGCIEFEVANSYNSRSAQTPCTISYIALNG